MCSLVPFGEVAFEVARDAFEDYRKDHTEGDLRADLERLAQASQAEVRQAAEAVAAKEAADQPGEVRQGLAAYLNQVPASIRQSLRRPSDPGGTTVSPALSLGKPEDLLQFLPAALPRFKPGDRPLAADWELVELLGKGGFGEVWKARHIHQSWKKPVALKFCLDPVAAATLRNEAALHDHLNRVRDEASAPGIVPLLETYLRADPPCLMYEYIEGGDLAGLVHEMKAQGRLTPEFATRIVHRLASIVAAAHRLDPPLVHRDLKMSNVLVRRGDDDLPNLYVADFGIGGLAAGQVLREEASRRPLSSGLLPTAIRGSFTPLYASPQQIRGERPDPRDDVHALGILWYQLSTGDLKTALIPPDWRDVVGERGLAEEHVRLLAACIASRGDKRPADAVNLAEKLAGGLAFDVKLLPTQNLGKTSSYQKRDGVKKTECLQHAEEAERQRKETIRLIARGLMLVREKDYDEAIKDLNEAIRLDPNKAFAYTSHTSRGDAWYYKEEYAKAINDYDEAIRLDPKNARAFYNRGRTWYEEEDDDRAIKDFDEAIHLDPNNALFYNHRGDAWSGKKDYDRAIKDFDRAIRLDPNNVWGYNSRADAWYYKEEYAKAINDYDEAIRLDPKDAIAFYQRGCAWSKKKDYDKAIKDFDEAIRLDPDSARFYNHRGDAWYCKKDYDKAIKDFDEAIRLDPENACAFYSRGRTWYEELDDARAIKDFYEAIRLDPEFALPFNNRGIAWSNADYDRAINDYDEAIRLDPNSAIFYHHRGFAWYHKEAYDKAIKDFDEAIRLDPNKALFYTSRGARYGIEDFDQAFRDFDKAIRFVPNYPPAFYNRGIAWY